MSDDSKRPTVKRVGTNGGDHRKCQAKLACTGPGCQAKTGKTRFKRNAAAGRVTLDEVIARAG